MEAVSSLENPSKISSIKLLAIAVIKQAAEDASSKDEVGKKSYWSTEKDDAIDFLSTDRAVEFAKQFHLPDINFRRILTLTKDPTFKVGNTYLYEGSNEEAN